MLPIAGPPTEPQLTDGEVTLRPWRPSDAADVFAACQDPEIGRWTNVPQPYEFAHAERFVATAQTDRSPDSAVGFAITDARTGRLLGSMSREPLNGYIASFGYWLAAEARGRGAATRALRLIVEWTLATTAVIRLEAYTDVGNDASARVLERAGFVREGIRRGWDTDRSGKPIDSVFFVRLRGSLEADAEAPAPAPTREAQMSARTRRAEPADFEAVADLNRVIQQMHADHLPDLFKPGSADTLTSATFNDWLAQPDGLLMVAEEDGRVVGYVQGELAARDETTYRLPRRSLYVNQLCVACASERRGHGRRLLATAVEHARRFGLTAVELDTWAFNSTARRFFEVEGFRESIIRLARELPPDTVRNPSESSKYAPRNHTATLGVLRPCRHRRRPLRSAN